MWNSITGTLTQKGRDSVCVSTHGIEWEILTSASSLADLPELGGEARLYVHLYHREMVMQLFGFASVGERSLFLELMKVDGVGPRLALRVLSGLRPEELMRAVRDRDAVSLSRVPGVGPKTAEKLILALTGKSLLEAAESLPSAPSTQRDLVTALAGMGFDRREASRAVDGALQSLAGKGLKPDELEKEALREAIRSLASGGG